MCPLLGWPEAELLGFDLETTGVDPRSDRPVSFALVTVERGQVTRRQSSLVDPGWSIPPDATAVHGISTQRVRGEGIPLAAAVALIADAIVEAGRRGVPVVGMKLDFDLTMVDAQCRRIDGRGLTERGWRGPVIDGLLLDRRFDRERAGRRTLGDLRAHYAVRIERPHDAACDAEAAVSVVRAMCTRYPELREIAPRELFDRQVRWHRDWVEHQDRRRREREFRWPIARAGSPLGE